MSRELIDNLKSARRFNEMLASVGVTGRRVVVKHIPNCASRDGRECDCTPAVLSVPTDNAEEAP